MPLLITCEHAGNHIPDVFRSLFEGADSILQSHRGWDSGAKELATRLAAALKVPLKSCDASRLLIEPNRSLDSPELFSEFTRMLGAAEKETLLQTIYLPYRRDVETTIAEMKKPVIHISIHSFTPVWNGVPRSVDIGLLFDPDRKLETELSSQLQKTLQPLLNGYHITFNEPYKGIDDGLTTYLRTKFKDEEYAGIEIEVNQKYTARPDWHNIAGALIDACKTLK